MAADLPRRIIPSTDVLFRELDGEAVMLDLSSERYFGLDEVGTRIWQLLATHKEPERVVSELLEEYDVSEEELRADMAELIAQFVDAGLIEIEPDSR